MRCVAFSVVALAVMAATGCTHVQLQRSTNQTIRTVLDIQQQQVLDNLAMFVVNPDATPYFAVPGGGTAAVTDRAEGSVNLLWNAFGITEEGLGVAGGREISENWTLAPINDPDKLNLMRCAYRAAVGIEQHPGERNGCPDCCELRAAWYGTERPTDTCVNPCVPRPGWFCVGTRKDVPKCACLVGCYCDTYVWVMPQNSAALHELTMVILDFATGEPNVQEVERTWTFDSDKDTYILSSVVTNSLEAGGVVPLPQLPGEPITGAYGVQSFREAQQEQGQRQDIRRRQNYFDPLRGLFFVPR